MKDSEIRYILFGMFENHELRFSEREALRQIIAEIDARTADPDKLKNDEKTD